MKYGTRIYGIKMVLVHIRKTGPNANFNQDFMQTGFIMEFESQNE